MTPLRKFLLKKFPTNKYRDCPISKERQELMQEYADQECRVLRVLFSGERFDANEEIERLKQLLEKQFIERWRDHPEDFKKKPLSVLLNMFKIRHNL